MFTNNQRQKERTGKYGSLRVQYLQELVSQFQNATDEKIKEKIVANLRNFAYDPYNYTFLRQLNVLELFLDCLTEPNEKLVEFGAGGICNVCAGRIFNLGLQLGSLVEEENALGALYYLCDASKKEEILKPEVIEVVEKFAAASAVSVSFSNQTQAFLDKHISKAQ